MQHRRDRRFRRRRLAPRERRRARPVAPPRTHGVQGHGTAQRARHRRGDRGRRRRPQRRDRRRADRLFRPRDRRGRRRSRSTCSATSSPTAASTRTNSTREERHRPGDRRGRGYARRSRLRSSDRGGLARPGDRPADPRAPAKASTPSTATPSARYLRRHYRRGRRWWSPPPARSTMTSSSRSPSRGSPGLADAPAAPIAPARLPRRRDAAQAQARADPCRRRLRGPAGRRAGSRRGARVRGRGRRRHVVAAVPGGAREARPRLLHLRLPLGLSPTPACSASTPARPTRRGRGRAASLDCLARGRRIGSSEAEIHRAKAQMKVVDPDRAGIAGRARAARAADADLRPAADARRDDRPRRGDLRRPGSQNRRGDA